MKKANKKYGSYYQFETMGGWVCLATCLRCGASVIVNEREDVEVHDKWHSQEDKENK